MLRGLPELDRLDARIIVRELAKGGDASNLGGAAFDTRVVELTKSKYTPDRDLEVPTTGANGRVRPLGLRHQNLAVARVAPSGTMPPAEVGALTVLFDTSASRALGFERQIAKLKAVVDDLRARSDEDFDLRIVGFDQTTVELFQGKASGLTQAHLDRIASRRALGASDLEGALRSIAADPEGSTRLLVISDGISTAGSAELRRVEEATKALAAAGIKRADAIVDGGIQDTSALKAMTTADLPDDGVVIDGRLPTETIAHKLGSAALPPIKVSVPGSEWVWPETIVGAQPGDEVLVYADLPASRAMKVLLEGEATITAEVPTTTTERPLLERAWVRARIDRLESERSRLPEGDRDMRDALKRSIIELSTKHRVLSDFTALLVLETEWDYRRFNIDRNALVDILSVGAHGITLDGRTQRPEMPALPPPAATTPKPGLYAMKGPTTPDPDANPQWQAQAQAPLDPRDAVPQMARNFDPDMAARQNGILGVMQQQSGHFLASPYGGAFAVGNDDADVWGGLTGSDVGEAYGVGGLGLVGTGRGGGGVGEGSIGIGAGQRESAKAEAEDVWGSLAGTEVGEAYGVGGLDLAADGAALKDSGSMIGGSGEGTIGIGNTGLIGKGGGGGTGSGYGRGSGAGFGGRGSRVPVVRQAKATVQGSLDKDIIRRIVRAHINEVRACYNQGLVRDPELAGRVAINFVISAQGKVPSAVVQESSLRDSRVGNCVAKAVKRWKFPKPRGGGVVRVTYPFVLSPDGRTFNARPLSPEEQARIAAEEARLQAEAERRRLEWEAEEKRRAAERAEAEAEARRTEGSPYSGRFFDVSKKIEEGDAKGALAIALAWRQQDPGDVLALVALGEAAEALGDDETAARAYGSLIDLFPARADLRRYAGNRLERLGEAGLALAVDTYQKAVESRPDHPASHRLYALALTRLGEHERAWEAVLAGRNRDYPSGRFAGVDKIFDDDAALIAAAWLRAKPADAARVRDMAQKEGVTIATAPSTHFVITWETDANDVDFHVHDGKGSHAYFGARTLPSGGELYADVTTGYGPESFTINGQAAAYPYKIEAHYYSRGPMGYGMGKLQIIQHDGKGGLRFDERPYLIMKDRAFVQLGTLDKAL
jgi:TonB family protein